MAVKFAVKEKLVEQENVVTKQSIAAMVDRIADLEAQRDEVKVLLDPIAKELAIAKGEFLEAYNSQYDDDIVRIVNGSIAKIRVGKRHIARTILMDNKKKMVSLFEKVKKGLFMECAKVNLSDIDKYLTPFEITEFVKEEKTETRTLKVEVL